MTSIRTRLISVAAIFSDEYRLRVPNYQPPYSGGSVSVAELLGEIRSRIAYGHRESAFLGPLVLIKSRNLPPGDVFEGHRMLVSLVVIMACLRELLARKGARQTTDLLEKYLYDFESPERGLRFRPRPSDAVFFSAYFANSSKVRDLPSASGEKLPKRYGFVVGATRYVFGQLDSAGTVDLVQIADQLLHHSQLLVIEVPSRAMAERVVQRLRPSDREVWAADMLKHRLLGPLSRPDARKLGERWTRLEASLGRRELDALLTKLAWPKDGARRGELVADDLVWALTQRFTNIDGLLYSLER